MPGISLFIPISRAIIRLPKRCYVIDLAPWSIIVNFISSHLDVVDIAQEIIAGASAVDEGAGVLAGEVVAEVTEKILDKNIGAEGAEVVGGIVGSVVGDLVEEKIETKLQENIDTEKPTDRR
jgi:hypothetical protein